jgi:hypothetical protein
MSDTELTQFHHCRQAGLSCQGTSRTCLEEAIDFFVNSNQVRYHTQNIEYAKYFSGFFPKVRLTTGDRLLETPKLQCHDHIVLSHNGLLVAKLGLLFHLVRIELLLTSNRVYSIGKNNL